MIEAGRCIIQIDYDDTASAADVIRYLLQQGYQSIPNSKVHVANMGPIWGRQDPGGPHVGPTNFAMWDTSPLNNAKRSILAGVLVRIISYHFFQSMLSQLPYLNDRDIHP